MINATGLVASDISRLPWPFAEGEKAFRYAVNVEPAPGHTPTPAGGWGAHIVDLGPEYVQMMADKRAILDADPGRAQVLPHMAPAAWDAMVYLMREMAGSYPETMSLTQEGDEFHWVNTLLGIEQRFTLGRADTLPEPPLTYITCQVPDDVLLVDVREDQLWIDAGVVTYAADWSIKFDAGMNLDEVHRPVPGLTKEGVTRRGTQFMMRLAVGKAFRRVNWTFSAVPGTRRDTALESHPEWAGNMEEVIAGGDFGRVQFRIELEHLIRLPLTDAIMFNIRTYLAPLEDIAHYRDWAEQLAAIISELPQPIAEYKGFDSYRFEAAAWLLNRSAELAGD